MELYLPSPICLCDVHGVNFYVRFIVSVTMTWLLKPLTSRELHSFLLLLLISKLLQIMDQCNTNRIYNLNSFHAASNKLEDSHWTMSSVKFLDTRGRWQRSRIGDNYRCLKLTIPTTWVCSPTIPKSHFVSTIPCLFTNQPQSSRAVTDPCCQRGRK